MFTSRPYRQKPKTKGDKNKTILLNSVSLKGFSMCFVLVESQEKDKMISLFTQF